MHASATGAVLSELQELRETQGGLPHSRMHARVTLQCDNCTVFVSHTEAEPVPVLLTGSSCAVAPALHYYLQYIEKGVELGLAPEALTAIFTALLDSVLQH